MTPKSQMDLFGAVSMTVFALLLGFNQVAIKIGNGGLQPVFMAGLRSAIGAVVILGWMRFRGIPLSLPRNMWGLGLVLGVVFAVEFLLLFLALDLTSVARASVMLYSMPVWLAIAGHFLLPSDRITPRKAAGLALALGGVAVALLGRSGAGQGAVWGDLLALIAAMAWASIALLARGTRLREVRPEIQLLAQLVVSAPVLLIASLFFGDLLRDPTLVHWASLGFQAVVVVSAAFLFWFWLLTIYPASAVAAFSFLSPVFGVALGWLLLGEQVGPELAIALVLVCVGLILINRPARRTPALRA